MYFVKKEPDRLFFLHERVEIESPVIFYVKPKTCPLYSYLDWRLERAFGTKTQQIASMKKSRREFIRQSALATAGAVAFSAKSYASIIGANDRVRVGVIGFSDRFRGSLLPSFLQHHKEQNFDISGVSDIWRLRREEGYVRNDKEMICISLAP